MDANLNLSPLASMDSTDGSLSESGNKVMNSYMQLQHMNQRNEIFMLNGEFFQRNFLFCFTGKI